MNKNIFIILLSLSIILSFAIFTFNFYFYFYNNNIYVYAQTLKQTQQQQQQGKQHLGAENITLYDPNLKIELVTSGLDFPTTMAFLGQNDFLILEKSGTVKRVTNGVVLDKPLLQVDVNVKDERGLLGIAVN